MKDIFVSWSVKIVKSKAWDVKMRCLKEFIFETFGKLSQ